MIKEFLISAAIVSMGVTILLLCIFVIGSLIRRNQDRKEQWICLKIRPPKNSERNPNVFEQVFSALHSVRLSRTWWEKISGMRQPRFSFEIANTGKRLNFFARCPLKYRKMLAGQIWANNPDAEIEEVEDYTRIPLEDMILQGGQKKQRIITGCELAFDNVDIWPIKRFSQFEDKIARTLNDPLSGITTPLIKIDPGDQAWIQLVFSPRHPRAFRRRAIKLLKIINNGHYGSFDWLKESFERNYLTMGFWRRLLALPFLFLFWILRGGSSGGEISSIKAEANSDPDMEMSRSHDRENDMTAATDKISRLMFDAQIRIIHISKNDLESAYGTVKEIAGAFKQFSLPQLNGFSLAALRKGKHILAQYQQACINGQMIMNNEELATVYHLPNITVKTPNIDWVTSKKLEPPSNLPLMDHEPDITILGGTNFRGLSQTFGIRQDDRRRHIYVVGKTGMGKSTILENMIFSDINSGKGVAVIDPHGDLAEAVLDFVPPQRTNDVILFDPADTEFPVSFNMLECSNPNNRHLVASGVVGVFKKIFGESWGPRLEHILRNTILALVEAPNTTMLGIMKMLVDDKYREQILKSVTDPMVLSFWRDEFGKWKPQQATEAISPIQNKVGQFLSSSITRNILGQPKSSIDLRFAMDKGKIIIVNLSKGKIGEDNSTLLGSMLVTKFQLDVMSRADIPEKQRRDFYLYVDEFQNFATDAFATILSEARKYRLNLTVANQYLAQMPDEVREAIFGNVGSMISFQVGFDDAEVLANQFGGEDGEVTSADLGDLPKYQIYLRLMIDGMPSPTFSANTLAPPEFEIEENRREKLLKVCRERYAKPRKLVEEKINKWSNNH